MVDTQLVSHSPEIDQGSLSLEQGRNGLLRSIAISHLPSARVHILLTEQSMSQSSQGVFPSTDHLLAIGRVATSWSQVEAIVEKIIWHLTSMPDDIGRAVTTHIGLETRLDIILNLLECRDIDDSFRKILTEQAKEIRELRPLRNDIIHGIYDRSDDESYIIIRKTTARGRIKLFEIVAPFEEIHNIADQIEGCSRILVEALLLDVILSYTSSPESTASDADSQVATDPAQERHLPTT